jgi:hypothetical protein
MTLLITLAVMYHTTVQCMLVNWINLNVWCSIKIVIEK